MKKVITFILILLPIFLIVLISVAGQIFAEYVFIPTTGVEIVSFDESSLPANYRIRVGVGGTAQVYYKVMPERATNKDVTFYMDDETIATVDAEGLITGVRTGLTDINVVTQSGNYTARMKVHVTDEAVNSIEIGYYKDDQFLAITDYEMSVDEQFAFKAEIYPDTALVKSVVWQSSDPLVARINSEGVVRALKKGTVIITATSKDGGKSASITLTVGDNIPLFAATVSAEDVIMLNAASVNLMDYIVYDPSKLSHNDIVFEIKSNGKNATLADAILTINKTGQIIGVQASTIFDGATYYVELTIMRIL